MPGARREASSSRVAAFLAALLLALVPVARAAAGVHAGLYVPNPPPVPSGPVSRALGNAYRAVIGMPTGPNAIAANAAYLQALQAAARGDRAGALADAAAAQAAALVVAPIPAGAPIPGAFPPPGVPQTPGVPIVSTGFATDPDIGSAANAIAIARQAGRTGPVLARAEAHYRAALDAFYDGDARKTRAEAHAALRLATDALVPK